MPKQRILRSEEIRKSAKAEYAKHQEKYPRWVCRLIALKVLLYLKILLLCNFFELFLKLFIVAPFILFNLKVIIRKHPDQPTMLYRYQEAINNLKIKLIIVCKCLYNSDYMEEYAENEKRRGRLI